MVEIKIANFDSGLELEARFENGQFTQMVVNTDDLGPLDRVQVTELVTWLQTTILGGEKAVVSVPQEAENQLKLPLKYDELADRSVGQAKAFSGVEVFDRSSQIPKGQAVKFTVPKKN